MLVDVGEPLDAEARAVPPVGRAELVLVDGRTFAISDEAGQMVGRTHGLVHDDLRHLSRFELTVDGTPNELLAAKVATPLSAVVVSRLGAADVPDERAVITRRRWIASGLREDVHVHNTSSVVQRWTLRLRLEADFGHVFDVKAGISAPPGRLEADPDGLRLVADGKDAATAVELAPRPDEIDLAAGTVVWHLEVAPRTEALVGVTLEPVADGVPAGLSFPLGSIPSDAPPMRRHRSWQVSVPRVTSTDPRLARSVEQALSDIAALRIVDTGHRERTVIAAGAPWFMTLFGRDSLLTSWMTLPFEPDLAVGVLASLADLQGREYDPMSEEQPGKILHELRRHGGGGPFATRSRYYGTVDATPLFVMLAAEAHRWGALDAEHLDELAPAVAAAVGWIRRDGDADGDGFVDYLRSHPSGLTNQGWKDSWDGVTSCDGSLPRGSIALAEVQGYVYAALHGAAELAPAMGLDLDPDELRREAAALRTRFNEAFWDERRGWFVMALDGDGRGIDALTTNPGHALWTGIAEPELADRYLDRLAEPAMWTGWGLRTLADTMDAYDPLSYHNGSVWPHDTALCCAGAARYGRWDLVDTIVDGALDAAVEFDGRPPELFSGIARDEAPMPVGYPASCSPQAWSSASVLLLVRTVLGLHPDSTGRALAVGRPELRRVPDLTIERLRIAGTSVTLDVTDGVARVTAPARRADGPIGD